MFEEDYMLSGQEAQMMVFKNTKEDLSHKIKVENPN